MEDKRRNLERKYLWFWIINYQNAKLKEFFFFLADEEALIVPST